MILNDNVFILFLICMVNENLNKCCYIICNLFNKVNIYLNYFCKIDMVNEFIYLYIYVEISFILFNFYICKIL